MSSPGISSLVVIASSPSDEDGFTLRVPYIDPNPILEPLLEFEHVLILVNEEWEEIEKVVLCDKPDIIHIIANTENDGFLWLYGKKVTAQDFEKIFELGASPNTIVLCGDETLRMAPANSKVNWIVSDGMVELSEMKDTAISFHQHLSKTHNILAAHEQSFAKTNKFVFLEEK